MTWRFRRREQVDSFAGEIAERGSRQALLRAHRGWLAAYGLVGLVVVGLGPAVPALVARVADRPRDDGLTVGLTLATVAAVLVAAVGRWLSTWIVRGLVYQMTHLVKLAVFVRLQVIHPQWLAICLVALLLPGRLTGGLALLLVVQQPVTAIREHMNTYGAVAWAATMGRDVEALFRDAPTLAAAGLEATAGTVRFGDGSVPPGARVVLLGASDEVRRMLEALTGSTGPAPAVAAVAGSLVTVSRGEPELDAHSFVIGCPRRRSSRCCTGRTTWIWPTSSCGCPGLRTSGLRGKGHMGGG
jgi:hypothetical protein